MNSMQQFAMKPLWSNHMQCIRYKALHCSSSAVFILWMYGGVCTGRLSSLISQLNAQGYSRNTGCYRVHAEYNKQYQHCNPRIYSAQQHPTCWKTQRTYTSSWKLLFCGVFHIQAKETYRWRLNAFHCMCLAYFPSYSYFKAIICFCFILFRLVLWCQAVTALIFLHSVFHGSFDRETIL